MSARTTSNLAARMGRWSADHWKTATFGWLAFVVLAFALGMAGTTSIDPNAAGPRESGRMDRILEAGFERPASESVLVQSRTLEATDPAFRAAVDDVAARLSQLDAVQNVRRGQVSDDGRSALVEFEIRGPADEAAEKIGPVLAEVEAAQAAHPQLYVGEFGMASAVDALATTVEQDLGKAGLLSLPITLVILVLAFGALVAAGIPLLLALTAVFATFGIVAGTSHLFPMANEAGALVLLIGLAVGVDYSLFYLKREREERAAGRSERAALEAAAATSGRSVLVSGLTVITAMAGMFLTGDPVFESFAIATIAVVAVAMLGSLTVLPALLSRLGDRVDRGRVPLVRRLRRDDGESRIWGAIVGAVLRRPLLSALLAGGLLVALALPALQLKLVKPGPDTFPQSLPAVQTYERMQRAFPGSALPANVVVQAEDVESPAMQAAIERLRRQALATGSMHEPITVEVNDAGTVANIAVPIDGKGTDAVSNASLEQLREVIVPATVGAVPGAEAGVTGATAQWKDSTDEMTSNLPLVVGFVLVLAFVLMLVSFRSPVIAAKAIVLNLLSVAAAYGVLVLVFQHGYGSDLLGFTPTGGIDPVVPLLLFVILFGLSMDYHVFLLSRIREAVQRGASTDEAVARGIKSTAGVVTSAAIVMVGVFAVFVTLSMLMFKQFGVGLATAILIDATIVRGVLLPASMKLLGDWNWYLPRWLRWLPRFDLGEAGPGEPGAGAAVPVAAPPRPRRRRRLRRLLPLGIVLAAGIAVAALSPAGLLAGTGNRLERPLDTAQLERSYEYGIGNYTVDLRDVELPRGTTSVQVDLAIGNLVVHVPDDVALVIDAHANAGKVDLLEGTSDGTDVDDHVVVQGATASAPTLELEADVGFGRLAVVRG
jgi:RND superfamily putative drug exporter